MQPIFSKSLIFSSLAVAVLVMAVHGWLRQLPGRLARPDAVAVGSAVDVRLGARSSGAIAAIRAWRLTAPDPRFGGISGLAVEGEALVALTDSGAVVRFEPPVAAWQRISFAFHDLPGGPGSARHKRGRDSEALLADPAGPGWWVTFEGRHSLWRFDPDFRRALNAIPLDVNWSSNRGGEGLASGAGGTIFVLPEWGGAAVAVGGSDFGYTVPRGTADATRLADGRLILLVRRLTPAGFRTELRISPGAGKPPRRIKLSLAPLDNPEAIAAAPLVNGGARLWIVTDDNFRPWMRTLLIALDLPPGA